MFPILLFRRKTLSSKDVVFAASASGYVILLALAFQRQAQTMADGEGITG
jgi:hypothetical protein